MKRLSKDEVLDILKEYLDLQFYGQSVLKYESYEVGNTPYLIKINYANQNPKRVKNISLYNGRDYLFTAHPNILSLDMIIFGIKRYLAKELLRIYQYNKGIKDE